MYIQLTRAQYALDKIDDAQALLQDSIFPAAQQQPGFRGAYWAVDRESGAGFGVSLWATKEHVDALETSGFYREQVAKAADVLDGAVERQVLEVMAQASPAS